MQAEKYIIIQTPLFLDGKKELIISLQIETVVLLYFLDGLHLQLCD